MFHNPIVNVLDFILKYTLSVFYFLNSRRVGCTTSDVIGAALTERAAHASPVASGYLLKQGGVVQCYGNVQVSIHAHTQL